jgi:hypothetical protein
MVVVSFAWPLPATDTVPELPPETAVRVAVVLFALVLNPLNVTDIPTAGLGPVKEE